MSLAFLFLSNNTHRESTQNTQTQSGKIDIMQTWVQQSHK